MGKDSNWNGPVDVELIRDVDLFFELLLHSCENTLLPELFEIFGRESILKLFSIFSGVTIKVPSPELIQEITKKTLIYNYYNSGKKKKTYKSVASHFDVDERYVKKVISYVKEIRSGEKIEEE